MFPQDFEHDGEFLIAPMPDLGSTWYERHIAPERRFASASPNAYLCLPEAWCRNNDAFDVAAIKKYLAARPPAHSFVDTSLFEDDEGTNAYLRTIYKFREDEWPWVHLHVPCIIGRYKGQFLLLDGNHRYARAKRLGASYFLANVLTEEETESFRIPASVARKKFEAFLAECES